MLTQKCVNINALAQIQKPLNSFYLKVFGIAMLIYIAPENNIILLTQNGAIEKFEIRYSLFADFPTNLNNRKPVGVV